MATSRSSLKTKKKTIKKKPSPISKIIVTRDSVFPDLSINRRNRESHFINSYGDSHHSGSYHLPPNRSQFEYLWANFMPKDRKIIIECEQSNPTANIRQINLKEFCVLPEDPDLIEKMQYCMIIIAYNIIVQINNKCIADNNGTSRYKKVDFIIPQFNYHTTNRDSDSGRYLSSEWRYRDNWVLFVGCHRWNDLLKCLNNDDWSMFWEKIIYIFNNKHVCLDSSDYYQMVEKYDNLRISITKKYIKDEYTSRSKEEESIISKYQLIKMISNIKLSTHALETIQRVIETCR